MILIWIIFLVILAEIYLVGVGAAQKRLFKKYSAKWRFHEGDRYSRARWLCKKHDDYHIRPDEEWKCSGCFTSQSGLRWFWPFCMPVWIAVPMFRVAGKGISLLLRVPKRVAQRSIKFGERISLPI
jgi:hypothetical protein